MTYGCGSLTSLVEPWRSLFEERLNSCARPPPHPAPATGTPPPARLGRARPYIELRPCPVRPPGSSVGAGSGVSAPGTRLDLLLGSAVSIPHLDTALGRDDLDAEPDPSSGGVSPRETTALPTSGASLSEPVPTRRHPAAHPGSRVAGNLSSSDCRLQGARRERPCGLNATCDACRADARGRNAQRRPYTVLTRLATGFVRRCPRRRADVGEFGRRRSLPAPSGLNDSTGGDEPCPRGACEPGPLSVSRP